MLIRMVGLKMKYLREEQGLSRWRVWRETGVNVWRAESLRRDKPLVAVVLLCERYGVTPDDFFRNIKND